MEKMQCPHCKSHKIAKVIYGLPDMTDELAQRIEDGEISLGGCMPGPWRWRCHDCGAGFREKPLAEDPGTAADGGETI